MELTTELSALEQIEFCRRRDIALGLMPQAGRLFERRKQLKERIAEETKPRAAMWYWIFGVAGFLAHIALAESGANFSFGLAIVVMTYVAWTVHLFSVERLRNQLQNCNDALEGLATVWTGATGYRTFWQLEDFEELGAFDRENDAFNVWWRKQVEWMRDHVSQLSPAP